MRETQSKIILGSGDSSSGQNLRASRTPVRREVKIGRNELVTITDGTKTETLKFKKAEVRLRGGDWKIVD